VAVIAAVVLTDGGVLALCMWWAAAAAAAVGLFDDAAPLLSRCSAQTAAATDGKRRPSPRHAHLTQAVDDERYTKAIIINIVSCSLHMSRAKSLSQSASLIYSSHRRQSSNNFVFKHCFERELRAMVQHTGVYQKSHPQLSDPPLEFAPSALNGYITW
jgi:hypothetical protein